jgi:hypothetical protein
VTLELRSRTRFEEPTYQVTLAVEVNGVEVGRIASGVPEASDAVLSIPADRAATILKRGFNIVTLRHVDLRKLDPSDTRTGGTLARRAGRGDAWPVAVYRLTLR